MSKIESLTIADSLNVSLLGIAIVFFVLVVLFVMIRVLRAAINGIEASGSANSVESAPVLPEKAHGSSAAGMVPAKGSVGEIKLHNVDDKTAALIMAIVADKMQAPLNELRFVSIREKAQPVASANTGGKPKK